MTEAPVATSVPAEAILAELRRLDVTHVVNVPDTHQRSLLAALGRQRDIQLITACTEDEAIAISAGLWIGGQRPVLSMQQVGLLAALNNVKGICIDARIPTCMLVGYFGRNVDRLARDNSATAVRLIEPTLDAWGVAYFPIEGPSDIGAIGRAYQHAQAQDAPAVVLIGAPTN